ncbi:hypothetical protein RclHR1_00830003 [Rhizophagus clarus]|uniref:Protein kinase domain-containing protein n=1 Tax=Rhizophagus clarus TaxID=94130 RepID=A0A2Z6SFI4_9GLOM|nr:hypothetical protein RclHR1_00830003 [Rhizophagus clarus]
MSPCIVCYRKNTEYRWCKGCNAAHFQQDFENWTSGSNDIDKFIQNTQLLANNSEEVLEWLPYDKFYNIEFIAKGGYGKVYKANWTDGFITNWNDKTKSWKRICQNKEVALKSLNNSKNVTLEFLNEITLHHKIEDNFSITRLYGITQNPETKNYIMVLDYADYGSLRNYLDTYYKELSWYTKFHDLWRIAYGLKKIHGKELIHRDLHIGNILRFFNSTSITDMGLCKPADYSKLDDTNNAIYGVLPYIAPEILRGQKYTKAADVYSFGIIMYEVISGLRPYHYVKHDKNLAMKICLGLRPRFNIKVPQLIVQLIKRCLDANLLNRPKMGEVEFTLYQWWNWFDNQFELKKQINEAEEINNNLSTNSTILSTNLSYETHSEAIYTSRLFKFNDLPEPKNSDDFYKHYDNITSTEFSESLQIDVSQLKMSDNMSKSIII